MVTINFIITRKAPYVVKLMWNVTMGIYITM
jgi:hypothetical protein